MIHLAQGSGRSGRFYEIELLPPDHVRLDLREGPVPDVEVEVGAGLLRGRDVTVHSRGVLVFEECSSLRGVECVPLARGGGSLSFDPRRGGVRTRENRLARGAFNADVTEATGFGMVNAFVHASRAAAGLTALLADLGVGPLPHLPVVVSAHCGSRLEGFAHADGDLRSGRMRPFSGGHYRLSQRTTGVPEPEPVAATGEVHLGPGRLRQSFAGQDDYLRAAAHNPATIYHEYGHHLCRHTADFRANSLRRPDEQRNGKPGVEEGICDYFAASFLGTGRPYGWYRARRGERRDPEQWQEVDDDAFGDAHLQGARWAAMWWQCRQLLVRAELMAPRDHDRVLVATLLGVGGPAAGRSPRREISALRTSTSTVVEAYMTALRAASGAAAVDLVGATVEAMLVSGSSDHRGAAC